MSAVSSEELVTSHQIKQVPVQEELRRWAGCKERDSGAGKPKRECPRAWDFWNQKLSSWGTRCWKDGKLGCMNAEFQCCQEMFQISWTKKEEVVPASRAHHSLRLSAGEMGSRH